MRGWMHRWRRRKGLRGGGHRRETMRRMRSKKDRRRMKRSNSRTDKDRRRMNWRR